MPQYVTEGLIDIHSHILPGVDDGACCVEEAEKMLRIAAENHIEAIIATPHFHPGRKNTAPERLQDKLEALQKSAPALKLVSGNEMYFSEMAFEALLDGTCLTLAGSRYVLVEFDPQEHYSHMRQSLFRIVEEGYRPILAHIERYDCLRKDFTEWEGLARMGVYFQVNANSVIKGHSLLGSNWLKKLLRAELVHFIASDCHNADRRIPNLQPCAELIAKKYGLTYARRLFRDNPEKVLQDEIL